ncbi:unnamed protein product, partial [Rotaria sp. Silwood2]
SEDHKPFPQKMSATTNDTSHSILTITTTTTKAINSINSHSLAECICSLRNEIYQMTCHQPISEISCGHIICY